MDFPWISHGFPTASEERPPLVLPVPLVLVSRDTVQDQPERSQQNQGNFTIYIWFIYGLSMVNLWIIYG